MNDRPRPGSPGSGSQGPGSRLPIRPAGPMPPRPAVPAPPGRPATGAIRPPAPGAARPATGKLGTGNLPPAEPVEAPLTSEEAQSLQRCEMIVAYADDVAAGRPIFDAMSLYKLFMDEYGYQDGRLRGMRDLREDLAGPEPTRGKASDLPRLDAQIASCEQRLVLLKTLAKQAIAAR